MKIFKNVFRAGALRFLLLAMVALSTGCASLGSKSYRAESQPQPEVMAESLISSADAALRAGDDDRALMGYVAALEYQPGNASLRYQIGNIHERKGDVGNALQAYSDVLKSQPGHTGAMEGLGLMLIRSRQHTQARSYLERVVAADVNRWRAHNGLGVIADIQREPEQARTHYTAALKVAPQESMLHNNLGYSYYLTGDFRNAVIHFERALVADADNQVAWANLGLVNVRLGNANGGVQAFGEIMEAHRAHNNVGYLFYRDGDMTSARSHLEKAINMSPSYYTVAHQNLQRVALATEQ